MSGVRKTGNEVLKGPVGASRVLKNSIGASGALGDLGLFDSKGSS